jgi:endonuclease-3
MKNIKKIIKIEYEEEKPISNKQDDDRFNSYVSKIKDDNENFLNLFSQTIHEINKFSSNMYQEFNLNNNITFFEDLEKEYSELFQINCKKSPEVTTEKSSVEIIQSSKLNNPSKAKNEFFKDEIKDKLSYISILNSVSKQEKNFTRFTELGKSTLWISPYKKLKTPHQLKNDTQIIKFNAKYIEIPINSIQNSNIEQISNKNEISNFNYPFQSSSLIKRLYEVSSQGELNKQECIQIVSNKLDDKNLPSKLQFSNNSLILEYNKIHTENFKFLNYDSKFLPNTNKNLKKNDSIKNLKPESNKGSLVPENISILPNEKKLKLVLTQWDKLLSMRNSIEAHYDTISNILNSTKRNDFANFKFQVLIYLILSQRTKDIAVFQAINKIKDTGFTCEKLSQLKEGEIRKLISGVSFYKNKAIYIKNMISIIKNFYQYDPPEIPQDVINLPGMGPKMTEIYLNFVSADKKSVSVSSHIHRVLNRLTWIKTSNYDETRTEIEKLIPNDNWNQLNYIFDGIGQTICTRIDPLCEKCFLKDECYFKINNLYDKQKSENKKKIKKIRNEKSQKENSIKLDGLIKKEAQEFDNIGDLRLDHSNKENVANNNLLLHKFNEDQVKSGEYINEKQSIVCCGENSKICNLKNFNIDQYKQKQIVPSPVQKKIRSKIPQIISKKFLNKDNLISNSELDQMKFSTEVDNFFTEFKFPKVLKRKYNSTVNNQHNIK